MSEQRRATLTPFGKSDKNTVKSPRKTFRFSFTLSDPSEDSCPVFDYGSVVKSEERKFIKKHCEKKSNGVFDSLESEEDIKKLAQKFEAKYGDKRSKCKSYAELGAGYDETDPFIDNTEAYDEAIQEDQETPCGGYYINSGPLELKRVEMSDQSDADEVGRRKQQTFSVINEDEEGDEEENEEAAEQTEIKSEVDDISELKNAKASEERNGPEEKYTTNMNEVQEPNKKKKKRSLEDKALGEDGVKNKKAKTVKALLEEKRAYDPSIEEPKKQMASITSISEAIESVVNASNNDENSNSSNSSHSATASTSTSEESQEDKISSQIVPPPLPENLSHELMSVIDHIKRTASVTDNTRKTFCPDINNGLIKLEWKSREFSAFNRNLLFSHLACYLPCTKDTLMRRAKKLFIHKEDSQIDTIICKLKATIDATMPSLLESYGKEYQRLTEEKCSSGNNEINPEGENNQTPHSGSTKLPKRKFPWTDETRGYLKEIVRLKNRSYKVLKPRKSTNEEYVTTFLHSKVRILWPPGWMKTSVLLKESNRSPHSGKSKHSSSHSSSKSDSPRLNISVSYPSPSPTSGTPLSLYVSPNMDVSQQQQRSPAAGCSPLAAKTGADPLNLLTKITTSLNTSPNNPIKSPGHHQTSKTEKPETFSMDCLLKRTSDSANCNDYSATLPNVTKNDSVIINGASLPLKHVNNSQISGNNSRSEKILDLSSCNSTVSGTPSVIQSVTTNERTAICASDSVSLNANLPDNTKSYASAATPCRKESPIESKKSSSVTEDVERRLTEETTTATDILSQIISESLRAPLQPIASTPLPYNTKAVDDGKNVTTPKKGQELLFDVMQDLKELNHMSSGGILDNKHDNKNNYSGTSWQHNKNSSDALNKSSQYHNEFLKHILNTKEATLPPTSTPPYSRHNVSLYENSQYMNEINKSMYNSTPHRSTQGVSSHMGSPSKVSQLNQGCVIKPLPNAGIPSRSESQSHQ